MASEEHVAILSDGVDAWNAWREKNRLVRPQLRGANLTGRDLRLCRFSDADLKGADLTGANLTGARFGDTYLRRAVLRDATLANANLSGANLRRADLTGAMLIGASLRRADLSKATLNGADLTGAILDYARLVETKLERATLDQCSVYGVSAWNLDLEMTAQKDLIITKDDEPTVTVDSLDVAQFLYLLLRNAKVRDVINTIATKAVLILGRFTAERKRVLDALREALRSRGLVPIIFDFERPSPRSTSETVSALAHLAWFVIADLTDPRSVPQELTRIVPSLPSLAVRPIILASQDPWAMFSDFRLYPWVLEPYRYDSVEGLIAAVDTYVIAPAETKARELTSLLPPRPVQPPDDLRSRADD